MFTTWTSNFAAWWSMALLSNEKEDPEYRMVQRKMLVLCTPFAGSPDWIHEREVALQENAADDGGRGTPKKRERAVRFRTARSMLARILDPGQDQPGQSLSLRPAFCCFHGSHRGFAQHGQSLGRIGY